MEGNKKDQKRMSKIETEKTVEKISETQNWFFKKISQTDKCLPRLTKKKRGLKSITSEMKEEKLQLTPPEIQRP